MQRITMTKIFRLYIKEELQPGKKIFLQSDQTHYLKDVVRCGINDTISCFDNKNGEFLCQIISQDKKNTVLTVLNKVKDLTPCPDIWLLFAPLKKDKTDFVIEKATELGVSRIIPTLTRYTITSNVKTERYVAQAIESAEQCHRTDLPLVSPATDLNSLIQNWEPNRTLFFMDETLNSPNFLTVLNKNKTAKAAILIGPEGGFSPEEFNMLRNLPFASGATLGPRILRAETAVAAALSCWQLISGDWSK